MGVPPFTAWGRHSLDPDLGSEIDCFGLQTLLAEPRDRRHREAAFSSGSVRQHGGRGGYGSSREVVREEELPARGVPGGPTGPERARLHAARERRSVCGCARIHELLFGSQEFCRTKRFYIFLQMNWGIIPDYVICCIWCKQELRCSGLNGPDPFGTSLSTTDRGVRSESCLSSSELKQNLTLHTSKPNKILLTIRNYHVKPIY